MKKLKTILGKEITIKRIYLLTIGVISLGLLVAYFSYALFQVSVEKQGVLNIAAGNLYPSLISDMLDENNMITVAAGETKQFNLVLENINSIEAKVNLYYRVINGDSSQVIVGYVSSTQDEPPGENGYVVSYYGNRHQRTIKVAIQNNGTSSVTVEFGTKVGLSTAPLAIPDNYSSLALVNISNETSANCFVFDGAGTITDYLCYEGNTNGLPTITNVVIPATINGVTVQTIDDSAFMAKNLVSVVIPNGITSIGAYAFQNNQLSELILPLSLSTIGTYAFRDNNLSFVRWRGHVNYDDVNANMNLGCPAEQLFGWANDSDTDVFWDTPEGCFYVEQDTGVLTGYNSNGDGCERTKIAIPNMANGIYGTIVKSIADNAFQGVSISDLEISYTLETIGTSAFANGGISRILFDDTSKISLKTINSLAFAKNRLTKVTIPESVMEIGNGAFVDNQLESVIINGKKSTSEFTTFGSDVFGWASGYSDSNITFEF